MWGAGDRGVPPCASCWAQPVLEGDVSAHPGVTASGPCLVSKASFPVRHYKERDCVYHLTIHQEHPERERDVPGGSLSRPILLGNNLSNQQQVYTASSVCTWSGAGRSTACFYFGGHRAELNHCYQGWRSATKGSLFPTSFPPPCQKELSPAGRDVPAGECWALAQRREPGLQGCVHGSSMALSWAGQDGRYGCPAGFCHMAWVGWYC